jgi:phytoene desaturase
MAEKSIIIIGAGLAGLAAGCYAQMNGYRTRIFEQHTRPGGVCTAWKRKGYTIDGCIHWLMGARPGCAFYELYREVGALKGNRLLPLDHLKRFVNEVSGQSLDITADLDRLAADMRAISPGDGPLIDELMAVTRAFRGFDPPVNLPQELIGPLAGLQKTWQMRRWLVELVRYNVPVAEFAGRFQDPFLRWAVAHVFMPEMPMTLLCVLLAQLAEGKLATVEGGSLEFALAIARRYVELGGQIVYGAPVQEILAEKAGRRRNRAVGVRLAPAAAGAPATAGEHHADVVISAADGHSTLFGMLGGRHVDLETRSRYETWPLFPPIVTVSYGVGRAYPGHPTGNMIRLEQPLSIAGQAVEHLSCRVFQGAAFAPHGAAVVQTSFTTDFDYWNDLQRTDRAGYEEEKKRVAGQVLERLEAFLPGLSAAVEMCDVATPYTLYRYTRNYRGAFEGWLITPEHLGKALPQTLPGLENFYMAGQWVEPGGGVPTVLGSGRQAVQLICHHDKVSFAVENV